MDLGTVASRGSNQNTVSISEGKSYYIRYWARGLIRKLKERDEFQWKMYHRPHWYGNHWCLPVKDMSELTFNVPIVSALGLTCKLKLFGCILGKLWYDKNDFLLVIESLMVQNFLE